MTKLKGKKGHAKKKKQKNKLCYEQIKIWCYIKKSMKYLIMYKLCG